MRLTLPRTRTSIVWLLKNEWARKGVYWDPKPKIPKIYQEKGVKIVDALEEFGRRERVEWTPPDPEDPRYKEAPPQYQQSRDYHETPARVFGLRTKLMEGAPQAQILTNTQILEGVPAGVKSLLGKVSVPSQDELCQRYILQANRWDATKIKLPKRVNVHRQAWHFKAETGIPKHRICSTMVRNLTRLCQMAATRNPGLQNARGVFPDYFMSSEIFYNDTKIRVQGSLEAAITSRDPVPPFADDSLVNASVNYKLPDMFPLEPTLQINPIHVYVDYLCSGRFYFAERERIFIWRICTRPSEK